MEALAQITLLGVRGSVPAADATRFGKYGCGTMCVLVRMCQETILLDAGSGLAHATYPGVLPQACTLLLSHPHVDHLLGLPGCMAMYERTFHLDAWAEEREGQGPKEQLDALMSPPLWPVGPEAFQASVHWRSLPKEPIQAGAVRIEHVPGNHPGGVTLFRLTGGGRSLVYATDCEFDEKTRRSLLPFAKDCDLLLCDAQFTEEEYESRRGWGHSSLSMALAFSTSCGAKRTVLIHHAPFRTDAALDEWGAALPNRPDCSFGRQGESFLL